MRAWWLVFSQHAVEKGNIAVIVACGGSPAAPR
jgi:hypothetical protein